MPTQAGPLEKTSINLLFDQIDTDNPSLYTTSDSWYDNVSFGTPNVLSEDTKNSSIDMLATPEGIFTGQVTFKYDRMDLSDIFTQVTNPNIEVPFAFAGTKISDLLSFINDKYKIYFQTDDIIDGDLSGTFPMDVSIDTAAGSLAYIGSLSLHVTQTPGA